MGAINEFLFNILNGINSVVGNYGWSIVVFTLIIKMLLLPLDVKSRKSMRRMSDLSPQVQKLQKKYANDKEKLNQKTAELYRKERISPLSGCLPMLLSFPVLIAMFGAMRMVANTELAKQTLDFVIYGEQVNQGWLWVKNLWMPDSPFSTIMATDTQLKAIPVDIWEKVLTPDIINQLAATGITIDTINADTYLVLLKQLQSSAAYEALMQQWSSLPQIDLLVFQLKIYASNNGLFITPILAAVTQFVMTLTQPQTANMNAANGKKGTGQFMKYFFPLFSLYICSTFNAGFSIYWVTSNLIAWGEGIIINKTFEKKSSDQKTISQGDSLK